MTRADLIAHEDDSAITLRVSASTDEIPDRFDVDSKFDNALRAYKYSPGIVSIQVRSFGTTTPKGKKMRRMISQVHIDAQELDIFISKLQGIRKQM